MQSEKAIETLMSHSFVPCEGGEHAIADQYLFAHLIIGRKELEREIPKKRLKASKKVRYSRSRWAREFGTTAS